MKKLVAVLSMALMSGSLMAANFGPFSYDDSGNGSVSGSLSVGSITYGGLSISNSGTTVSSTTINATTPVAGSVVVCNTCTYGPGTYAICIATAANSGAWVVESSSNARRCN